MNQWWDKDEEKAIASVVAGLIILFGIAILSKPILFIIALFFIANRVLHRCNVWTLLEDDLCGVGETVTSPLPSNSHRDVVSILDEDIADFEVEEVDVKEVDDEKEKPND